MFGKRTHDAKPALHFRSDRISNINGEYFFSTRENTLIGPFSTKVQAQCKIQEYISEMSLKAQHS